MSFTVGADLDPAGIDLVLFPELSICFLDATKPHEYDPELKGDEDRRFSMRCVKKAEEAKKKSFQLALHIKKKF